MNEQLDHRWGDTTARGKALVLAAFFMTCGLSVALISKVTAGLENDLANGWRITVTEPLDNFLDNIYNTPNLNVVIGVGFAINAGLACLWLASYWASKASRQNT